MTVGSMACGVGLQGVGQPPLPAASTAAAATPPASVGDELALLYVQADSCIRAVTNRTITFKHMQEGAPRRIVGQLAPRQRGKRTHMCCACDFPISVYGRCAPCLHAFCLTCAANMPRCIM